MLKHIVQVEPWVIQKQMALYRESMAQLARRFESPQAMEQAYGEFLKEFVTHPNQLVLVEEVEGVWVSGLRCVECGPGVWYLEALETAPQARGKGWAKQLLCHTRQVLEEQGAHELFGLIDPQNTPSIAAHLACGFVATQREPVNGWGEKQAGDVLYAWQREGAPICT